MSSEHSSRPGRDARDERVLLLLGLLAAQRLHGYRINDFIERNLGRVSRMPKATAYTLLARLERDGLVEAIAERAGNRPERRVYAITPTGAERYHAMLEDVLGRPEPHELHADHALMFIDSLPRAEALRALRARIAALEAEIAQLDETPGHGAGIGVDLALSRRAALLRADHGWFVEALERVLHELPEEPVPPGDLAET